MIFDVFVHLRIKLVCQTGDQSRNQRLSWSVLVGRAGHLAATCVSAGGLTICRKAMERAVCPKVLVLSS